MPNVDLDELQTTVDQLRRSGREQRGADEALTQGARAD